MATTEQTALLPQRALPSKPSFRSFLSSFWPITFIAFGGPQAHVALFHETFVASPAEQTPKVPQSTFLELYALAQSLPGPGSTQLATSLGATFGGISGAIITFLIWHLPGFFVMTFAGVWFHSHLHDPSSLPLVQRVTQYAIGLISAAYAFVLIAAFKIVGTACADDNLKMAIALLSMFIAVVIPPASSSWVFILLLVAGGLAYFAYSTLRPAQSDRQEQSDTIPEWDCNLSQTTGIILLLICAVTTVIVAALPSSQLGYKMLKIFWRIGLCVFGGGIIVVPMLMKYVSTQLASPIHVNATH